MVLLVLGAVALVAWFVWRRRKQSKDHGSPLPTFDQPVNDSSALIVNAYVSTCLLYTSDAADE